MAWDQQIVSLARRGKRVTVGEVAQALDLTHARALSKCLQLIDSGDLVDLGGGWLVARPDGRQSDGMAPPAQVKLWKTAWMLDLRGEFLAGNLALVAETSPDYAKEYLRWLEKQGHVIGRQKPGLSKSWRLAPNAPPADQAPAWTNTNNRALRARKRQEQGKG